MNTERRQHPRKIPTEFTFIQLEQEFGGRVLNYSKEGLCFETLAPICSTDLVQFWFSLQRHAQIDGVGRVAWLNDKKNLGGIAFVHLSRTARERVDEWAAPLDSETARAEDGPKPRESPEDTTALEARAGTAPSTGTAPPSRKIMEEADVADAAAAWAQETERALTPSCAPSAVVPPKQGNVDLGRSGNAATIGSREPESTETLIAALAATITPAKEKTANSPGPSGAQSAKVPEPGTARARNSASPSPAATETLNLPSVSRTAGENATQPVSSQMFNTAAPLEVDAAPFATDALMPGDVSEAWANRESGLRDRTRKWPISTPPGSATPTEQTDDSSKWNSSSEGLRELVPLRQYLHARRSEFLRGAAIGIFISVVIAISIVKFWRPGGRGSLTEEAQQAVSANSSIASGATIPTSSAHANLGQQSRDATLAKMPTVVRANSAARKEPSPQPSESPSAPDAASASVQISDTAVTNAVPKPGSFAYRNSGSGSASQPGLDLPQQGNFAGPAAEAELGNGQPKIEADLGSTPWSFRRKNIHGTPPVGGEFQPAQLLSSVTPQYPVIAKNQHIAGEVTIDAIVDKQGNVRKALAVSGPMPLRGAALSAVAGWKYKPALLDGKPTEVHETIIVKFRSQ